MNEKINQCLSNIKGVKYDDTNIMNDFAKINKSSVLCEIKNNNLIIKKIKDNLFGPIHKPRLKFVKSLISETLKLYNVPNMRFIVCLEDGLPSNMSSMYLGSTYDSNNNCVPFPINWCHYFSDSTKIFEPKIFDNCVKKYRDNSNKLENHKKNNKIIFRGSYNHISRKKLYLHSKRFQQLLDVKFTKQSFIPMDELLKKYKYFFVVRGNGPWSGSMNQYLCSDNCVIFKIESKSKQVIDLLLQPYENFIPIKDNFTDFKKQIEYVNDTSCMNKIMQNNKCLSESFFTSRTIMYYTYQCLMKINNVK